MATNISAVDGFTLAHAGVGFALRGLPRPIAYAIFFGTEFVELFLRNTDTFRESGLFNESPVNILADLAVSIGTYELSRGET